LKQQIALFNAASGGSIQLSGAANQGDYSDKAFFQKISGLVRRRNAYGTGSVSEKTLEQLVDTMVKIAAGTPPIRLDKGQFNWIQMNPQVAGAALGQQLAGDMMADMLNIALGGGYAALSTQSANIYDATDNTSPEDLMSVQNLIKGAAKFGDQASSLIAWVMHSKQMHDLYANNALNAQQLFNYGSINIARDAFGRLLIMTDCPNLYYVDTVPNPDETVYTALGLTSGAIIIEQNNDFDANEETNNGDENITRTYQAEWSYNLGIRGFAWDKTNGGKSPTDAALLTATNWDKYATSAKDLAGVVVKTL
jgi:hypothetical protein